MATQESIIIGRTTGGGEAGVNVSSAGDTQVVGQVEHDSADTGQPVKIGLQARTTNITAVGDADRVNAIGDDVGRLVNWPYQVRDLINTAYVSITNGTATALIAGVTDVFLDLVQISLSNNSGNAASVVLNNDSTTIQTFLVNPNATTNYTFPVPIRATSTGSAWNVDMADITGTTVTIQAQFIRNV